MPAPAQKGKAEATPDEPSAPANTAIAIRSNFNPLAAFSPAVKTGPDGKATVEVKVPDNLTRYRIVAVVAAGDKQFGKGENALTARLPLMVRPSPPRFLNFGDTFSYALASVANEPLLFVGDHFGHTDVTPALPATT